MIAQPTVPHLTENDALRLLEGGPSETVEIRGRMTSARVLADLIAGFAHGRGGHIFFGYHRRKKKVVGCRPERLNNRYQESLQRLSCEGFTTISYFEVHGRQLCVVTVPQVARLIASPSGLVRREGTGFRVLPKDHILAIVNASKSRVTVEDLARAIVAVQDAVRGTNSKIDTNSRLWSKIKEQVLGFVVGSLLTAGVAYLVSKLR